MNAVVGSKTPIVAWLSIVCLTILAIIVVGGVTRLTHSGLSIVEWQPIIGVIPPLTQQEWESTFEAYKQYPEYQMVNRHMDLSEFKSIFYWEYFHRLIGRMIGFVFFVPFIIFWAQKRFSAQFTRKLLIAFAIGCLQGLMGWYMVMSGLVDMPRVSHYRLAAHLSIALLLLAYLFWIILDLLYEGQAEDGGRAKAAGLGRFAVLIVALISLQIVYGAFTAGLRAGFGYNTFPLMNEKWIADAVGVMDPFWINFFESHATVQFIHRYLGLLVAAMVFTFWIRALRANLAHGQMVPAHILLFLTLTQFLLGVLTLIWVIPVLVATLHQAVAALLLLGSIYVVHRFRSNGGSLVPA